MRSIKAGLLATLAIFLYCCNSHNFVENSQTDVDRSNIEFSALVEHNGSTAQTRKSGNDWTSGDAVGLFSFESGKPNSQATVDENVNNRKFITTTGDGIFSSEEGHIPYPAEKRDFISYFPFSNATAIKEDLTYSVDITNQNDINAIDLLYSNNLKNFDGSVKPELLFKHALARLDLTISSTKFSLKGAKVELVHLLSKADFNLVSQALLVDNNSATNVTLPIKEVNGKLRAAALILPTGKTQDFSLKITLSDGQLVYWSKHKDKGWKWESGKIYTQEIQIGENGGVDPEPEYKVGYFETPVIDKDNLPKNIRYIVKMLSNNNPNAEGKQRNFEYYYDIDHNIAYWVAYPLHKFYTTKNTGRYGKWHYDDSLEARYQVDLNNISWSKSQLDRGHQVASSDRVGSVEMNKQTFTSPNVTPQYSNLNQKIWNNLENKARSWVSGNDTIYAVTGAGFYPNKTIEKASSKNPKASIPHYYYKVFAKKEGNNYYTIGFLFDHHNGNYGSNIMTYKKTVSEVEKITGFKFFPGLPDSSVKDTIIDSKWN